MGCNVTSIYGDQVIGKIYYPDQILNDLRKRDFCQPFKIKDKKQLKSISSSIVSIYGFNQSFCQGYAFTTVIDHNQFLVYNNGRFIIKILKSQLLQSHKPQPQMTILPHEDQICVMDVNDNMCVVGLSGGKFILWDLKFNQMKIQIYLPKPSSSFSSISLTKKYIFFTDTTLPNNIAYCFDIQTTKLKGSVVIDSLQPTLKGTRFQENHHVTISAEGLWFFRYSSTHNILQSTKGMFLTFPKTSQCSITTINDQYLVSGGVDGYIYVWNNLYQCIKVIKCFEQQKPITAIAYSQKHNTLIMGSLMGKIKCFSFSVKLKAKKRYEEQVENENVEKEQDVEYLLTEALDQDFGIQNVITSHQDTLLYFSFHCRGTITSHLLPSNQPYPMKIRSLNNLQLMRFSRKGDICIEMSSKKQKDQQQKQLTTTQTDQIQLTNVYPSRIDQFNVDKFKVTTNNKWLQISKKSVIKSSQIDRQYLNFYSYSKVYNSVAFISDNFIVVNFQSTKTDKFSFKDPLQTNSQQLHEVKRIEVMEMLSHNKIVSMNYLQIQNPRVVFLIVTFQEQCNVFEVKNKKEYLLHTTVKFLKNRFNNFKIHMNLEENQVLNRSSLENQPLSIQLPQNIHELNQLSSQIERNQTQHLKHDTENSIFQVEFHEQLKVWKLTTPIDVQNIHTQIIQTHPIPTNEKTMSHDLVQTLPQIHCSYLKEKYHLGGKLITIGGSSIIFWHLQKNIKK